MGESNRWNNYAISTADLATSLTKSSGSLVAANGTLEEAVALTATANTIIQDSDVVGTALKTVAMRLRGTSTEEMEEEGLDIDGAVTSKSKLQSKIKSLSGVDILTDTGAYKSTYQILSEIADVWEDINDMDQAALLELLAGKRAGSVMSAILQNPETLKDAFESANEASGSALTENEKYLDSIQGRIDLFNNAVQTMWSNALDDDFVKFIVNVGTQLVKVIDNLGLIKTLVIAIGTYAIQKHWKGDLLGGLLSEGGLLYTSIDNMKDKLNELKKVRDDAKAELDTDPDNVDKQKKYNKAQKKYDFYNKVSPHIAEYDKLSEDLKQYKADAENAKNALNSFNKELEQKGNITAKDIAQQDELTNKYNDANKKVVETEDALKKVEIQANATGMSGLTAGQKIKTGFMTAGKAVLKFGKKMLTSMATMYVISTILELITKLGHGIEWVADQLVETPEEAQEKFEELNEELSGIQSEISSLNSELEKTQDRIDELLSQGSLSFTDQEELERLRAENDELERKIKLNKALEESKQKGVNAAAVNATDKYISGTSFGSDKTKSERQEEAKETGSTIGKIAGGIIAAALIALGVLGEGITFGASTGLIVLGAGMMAGGAIGGAVGSGVAGAAYDSEQSVGEAMDNMVAQRAELQKKQEEALADEDTAAYNEATEALSKYDEQMATHIDQIQANYNAMDWSTATTEQKKNMMEYADWLDKYSISMGATGAKSSAIERIFGGAEASQELKRIDKDIKNAMKSGEEIDFYEMFNSASLIDTKNRLAELGISITDLKYYYLDWKEVEEEVEGNTYETVKSVGALTDGIGALKDAFSEFQEEGLVTADTLVDLYDTFGSLGDAWDNYVDVMATGTASTHEARKATEELLEALMNQQLDQGPIKDMKEYLALIGQLQNLGVSNAKGYVDALQKSSMISSIAKDIVNQEKELAELEEKKKNGEITEEEYEDKKADLQKTNADFIKQYEDEYKIDLSDEEERVLIEKAITAEKTEQAAVDAQVKSNEYNAAVKRKEEAEESAQTAQEILDIMDNPDVYLEDKNIMEKYGLSHDWSGWTYKGQYIGTYDELREKLEEDVANGENIELPTAVDVDGAEQQAKDAQDAYQQALDELGVTIQIELYDSGQNVDNIQSVFDTLASAQKEYNEEGYFSVDTMQSLLELEPKYLALLYDENGNLNLNKQALYEVAKARIIDLGIKQKTALINNLVTLSEEGSTEALMEHMNVTGEAIKNNDDYIKSNLQVIRTNLERRKSEGDIGIDVDAFMSGVNSQLDAIDRTTNIAVSNLKNTLSSSGNTAKDDATEAFQKAMSYYENRIGAEQSRFEQVQNEIDLLEKQGKIASEDYYEEQIASENRRLSLLQQQKAEAKKYLGQFKEGSDEWWDVANQLNDIESEIDSVTSSIQDLNDAMDQIHWDIFDETHKRFGNLTSQLQTIRDLLSADEDSFFNDEGEWTETGVAVLGTHIQELEMYENALKMVQDEIKNLNINDFDSEQEYYDKKQELIEQEQDYAKAVSDSQQSVIDMYESQIDAVEEYTSELVDAYNEYIDVVKESLDAERDLYEFRKDVQKQTKDIASLERRIASLSGSDSASDIAERRKLEAELNEAKEGLNDSYYDHAKDAQSEALDREAEAYEESMTNYIDTLREKLDQAKLNMDLFMEQVTTAVTINAGVVLTEYTNTGIAIDKALTEPWVNAAAKMKEYEGNTLPIMNTWTSAGGVFYNFDLTATDQLTSPWKDGQKAVDSFKTSVDTAMGKVVNSIKSNVSNSITELNKLQTEMGKINDTTVKPTVTTAGGTTNQNPGGSQYKTGVDVTKLQKILNQFFNAKIEVDGVYGPATTAAVKAMKNVLYKDAGHGTGNIPARTATNGEYDWETKAMLQNYLNKRPVGSWFRANNMSIPAPMYAKGTLGTKSSGFAITDESWIGEEITLAAGKNGQLQYLKKGSAVMPADISANLVEWGKLNPNMMNLTNPTANINMINNAVSKPEFNLTFDSLVHVDHCDEGTLKNLEKMVDTKINDFSRQLNYSVKKFAR